MAHGNNNGFPPAPDRGMFMGADVVVGYHYPCPDGAFGALAASIGLTAQNLATSVHYVPMTVYGKVDERLVVADSLKSNQLLLLVDFSGGPEFIKRASARAKQVVILDHHKTAMEELQCADMIALSNLYVIVDMHRSGATIARDFFGIDIDGDIATIFDYIEDNDLWRHQMRDSKAFSAGLAKLELEYDVNKNMSLFDSLQSLEVERLIEIGNIAIVENQRILQQEADNAHIMKIPLPDKPSLTCLGVQTAYPNNRSELGNLLAIRAFSIDLDPVAAIFYEEENLHQDDKSKVKLSFRSTNGYDVASVAHRFGGGGHQAAASCLVARTEVDGWRDDSQFVVRPFEETDMSGVLEVCLKTGDAGNDATQMYPNYPELLGLRWVAPYCIHLESKELAFVLSDPLGVCGYVLGALDSKPFYGKLRNYLSEVSKRYPKSSFHTDKRATEHEINLWTELQAPSIYLPSDMYQEFPSHLHIDISPRAQGRRMGIRMMNTLLTKLRELGSKGVHLEMAPTNERALKFYTRLGFKKLESPPNVLYLGKQLI